MIRETLYKRTSTGKIQIWFAEIEGDKYRTTSGQQDGKKTTSDWTFTEAKNIGKANATTAEEQAIVAVESMYTKQRKKDYRDSVGDVDTIERFKPMLATKWQDLKDKIKETTVHLQPKLDGMRCIAKADGLWTRNGERLVSIPHIEEALKEVFKKYPNKVLDGELYNHDLKDDFNKIVSCAKKTKPTAEDLETSRLHIQYWVYDIHDPLKWGKEEVFEARHSFLSIIHTRYLDDTPIKLTPTAIVKTDMVDEHAAIWIELGFEGAMVRTPGPYQNKRSKFLIKWKEMMDEEFEIIDIQEGAGNRAGIASRIILKLPGGRTFAAGVIGNFDYSKWLLDNKNEYIGQSGTVVFQNYTPDGIPRFPKFKAVRNYE